MRLSVVGAGYLGATHAACMAELGHEVLAVDTDARKVAALQSGRAPFFEPGLDELLKRHTASGRLRFTTETADECAAVLRRYRGEGDYAPEKYTRGLFYRGVE